MGCIDSQPMGLDDTGDFVDRNGPMPLSNEQVVPTVKLFDLGQAAHGVSVFHQDTSSMEARPGRRPQALQRLLATHFLAPPWMAVQAESRTESHQGYILASEEVERKKAASGSAGIHLPDWLLGLHAKKEEVQASSTDKVLKKIVHRHVLGSLTINVDSLSYYDLSADLRRMLESGPFELKELNDGLFRALEGEFGSNVVGKVQIGGLANLTIEESGTDSTSAVGHKGEIGLKAYDQGLHVGAQDADKDGTTQKESTCSFDSRPAFKMRSLTEATDSASIVAAFKKEILDWEETVNEKPEAIGELSKISLAKILLAAFKDLQSLTEKDEVLERISGKIEEQKALKIKKHKLKRPGLSEERQAKLGEEILDGLSKLLENSEEALEKNISFLEKQVSRSTI